MNKEYDEFECKCNTCGHKWNALTDSEHFNFTFCEACTGMDIGGNYHDPTYLPEEEE